MNKWRILHTESSTGWGGQEMRILREALGMRKRGHEIFFAVERGGHLVERAKREGFLVYEIDFSKYLAPIAVRKIIRIIKMHQIHLVNTHSSLDAWIAAVAARLKKRSIVRTRHLSTSIRAGVNSRLLYGKLADFVVTTSSAIVSTIVNQANISKERCRCIATGVDEAALQVDPLQVRAFRDRVAPEGQPLIGTACVVRSWKGIEDLLYAANILRQCKWVIIGGGYLERPKQLVKELQLEKIVHFTGHLENPYPAIASLDFFALLSTAHEGISQALLQAAYLGKPLIATRVGGSPEICIEGETGRLVSPSHPDEVVRVIQQLIDHPAHAQEMGENAHRLVANRFTMNNTLDEMESVYAEAIAKTNKKDIMHSQ